MDAYTVDHHTAEFRSHSTIGRFRNHSKGDFHTVEHHTVDSYLITIGGVP